MIRLARLALLGFGVVLLGNGIAFLVSPSLLTRLVEVVLPSPLATMEIRGTYGGLWIGIGGLFVLASLRSDLLRPGLIGMLAAMGGLALGRIAGLVADGPASGFLYSLLAFEVLGTAVALMGLRALPALPRPEASPVPLGPA